MCGGFVGDFLGKTDPIFNKNNPQERKQRKEAEAISAQDKQAADNQAADLAAQTNNNQAVQAEAVAGRRRKAAQSLLGQGSPGRDDAYGNSTLARAGATGVRATLG